MKERCREESPRGFDPHLEMQTYFLKIAYSLIYFSTMRNYTKGGNLGTLTLC